MLRMESSREKLTIGLEKSCLCFASVRAAIKHTPVLLGGELDILCSALI